MFPVATLLAFSGADEHSTKEFEETFVALKGAQSILAESVKYKLTFELPLELQSPGGFPTQDIQIHPKRSENEWLNLTWKVSAF